MCFDQVIVDGMEYQPIVASGNKKTARIEAALASLQELAALPVDEHLLPQPQAASVSAGVPRPPAGQRPQLAPLPKPVRPLMSLQPRPQFSSLQSYRPPNPITVSLEPQPANPAVSSEPAPPGVDDVSDFISNVFNDFQKFQSTPLQISTDQSPKNGKSLQPENALADKEQQVLSKDEENSFVTSRTLGLLGDAPPELEAVLGEDADDGDFHCAPTGFNQFPGAFRPPFLRRQHAGDMPGGMFGENAEDIDPDFSDIPLTVFERPRWRIPPWIEDFTEDTFINDGPGLFGEYEQGSGELCRDYFEPCDEFEPPEEDLQSDVNFQTRFGQRPILPTPGILPTPSAVHRVRRPVCPLMSQRPRMLQRFPRGPPQQFPGPSFNMPSPRCPPRLPRGAFRPRVQPFGTGRPFPRPL